MQNSSTSSSDLTSESWRNTILAGLANYIDAGSIVAGGAALTLWAEVYHLTPTFVGMIAAFSANAIAAGIGALIGGRLCDRFGRKKVYQADMLFYAFGMGWLVFASHPWMIVVGFVCVGLAVGADIPASWSLIAETAPDQERSKRAGVANLLWLLGPLVVFLMLLLVESLGVLGAKIVLAHLLMLALLLALLRSRMQESQRWTSAERTETASVRTLFEPQYLTSIAFLIGTYGIWNLYAGTFGLFFNYILRTVGSQSQATILVLQSMGSVLGMASTILIFMRYADRVNQRRLFVISAILQIGAISLYAIFPLSLPLLIISTVLSSIGVGFSAGSFFTVWSAELFPTVLRATAQGLTVAIVRIGLGIWSFFVPLIALSDFQTLAWMLTAFLVVSSLIGAIWTPRNEGKSLEQIEAERGSARSKVSLGAAYEQTRPNPLPRSP